MKKFLCILLVLLCFCAGGLAEEVRVFDEAGLFSASEEARLESAISDFQEQTGMDFVVVTIDTAYDGYTTEELADELYAENGFGLGENRSGALFLIDMNERIFCLSTAGDLIDYVTDGRLEEAYDAVGYYMGDGEYAAAVEKMLSVVRGYIRKGVPEGQYQYDALTGERLTDERKAITSMELLISVGAAALVAFLYVSSVNSGYNLKGSTYDYPFRQNSTLDLTDVQDQFIRTTTTRTRKATPPPSGGSSSGGIRSSNATRVRTSSSGMRHGGGGGRRF